LLEAYYIEPRLSRPPETLILTNVVANENKIRKTILKTILKFFHRPEVPDHISANFREIDNTKTAAIRSSLERNFFVRFPDGYLSTEPGQKDLQNHLFNRLEKDRSLVVPWLDNSKSLRDSRVLEIGCGTGCSTVALAEQGAKVTAVDVDAKSLVVANDRCRAYGLDAGYFHANATEVDELFSGQHFDFIIFYASLEHMTIKERLIAMKKSWDMLSAGDLWCVIETPNRLWYYDAHTSLLPFYLWLPDDLAYQYSRLSPRDNFRELYNDATDESMLHFLRRGRGVSFHEFELSMKPVEQLNVISSRSTFHRKRKPFARSARKYSLADRYISFLSEITPRVHEGFCQPTLDLIIRKD
jgi:2-polyprenyl-3-methyl-5-hydroxy-6-metoxy-1,4-benzoquinol methylase